MWSGHSAQGMHAYRQNSAGLGAEMEEAGCPNQCSCKPIVELLSSTQPLSRKSRMMFFQPVRRACHADRFFRRVRQCGAFGMAVLLSQQIHVSQQMHGFTACLDECESNDPGGLTRIAQYKWALVLGVAPPRHWQDPL